LIKSEEDVFKFASDKAEKLFKLTSELNTVESSLEGKFLIGETEQKLKESKDKILEIFDVEFEVKIFF